MDLNAIRQTPVARAPQTGLRSVIRWTRHSYLYSAAVANIPSMLQCRQQASLRVNTGQIWHVRTKWNPASLMPESCYRDRISCPVLPAVISKHVRLILLREEFRGTRACVCKVLTHPSTPQKQNSWLIFELRQQVVYNTVFLCPLTSESGQAADQNHVEAFFV